jgi:hypothetical protein
MSFQMALVLMDDWFVIEGYQDRNGIWRRGEHPVSLVSGKLEINCGKQKGI